ncbi:sugar kinase [Leptodesmis sichuanensis]|uniref:sugar kinase n=1 Tax=Leptodesmis sichuanensis TaxID=2906798 RepID=UPI001F408ED7|nr:sugar kinase [Leptodesmis sichuanensis]UIE36317.1 sugar kinase [Leptodesmis sichuanensis A121]
MKQGLFVGLTTLDLIYQAAQLPDRNQKIVATDYVVSAGGPATNAAIAFRHLGNQATVLSVVGAHPMSHLILTDLREQEVHLADLHPTRSEPPPVSSIIVTQATGERAVISINTVNTPASPDQIPSQILQDIDIVLIDGHQMAVGRSLAQQAHSRNIPVVIDGGSWKSGFDSVLPFVTYAVCSANFHAPGCHSETDVISYLSDFNIPYIAITHGEKPITYRDRAQIGQIPVPTIPAVDTLGAGDIFHGAFCHFILHTDFVNALEQSAQIAAHACQFFGTRRWMEEG